MKMNQSILGALAAASLLSLGMGAAHADTVGSFTATGSSPLVTFTGGASGVLSVPNAASGGDVAFANSPVDGGILGTVFTFGPVSVTGPAITNASGTTNEALSGGSFALKSGSSTLLSGDFAASNLSGILGNTSSSVLSFGANSVTYTGGSFLTDAGFHSGDIGSFSLALSGMIPALSESGTPTHFDSFTVGNSTKPGGLTGTFDVTPAPVPEATGLVPFALGGLSLFGLVLRGRKSRRASGMTA